MEQKDQDSSAPKWIRPEEVMKMHRLKRKKRQLQEPMMNISLLNSSNVVVTDTDESSQSCTESEISIIEPIPVPSIWDATFGPAKRKNPFRRCDRFDYERVTVQTTEIEDDNSLLNFFNRDKSVKKEAPAPTSFNLGFFSQMGQVADKPKKGKPYVPIDWTLKSNVRFTSSKPFAWKDLLTTCDEASGISGFVRCLSSDSENERGLDTSPNARLHQCCLLWQHPSLPWLTLFPRSSGKVSETSGITDKRMTDALFEEFAVSLQSLYKLVRARHCPYFYVCANNFTCLFRAAGIGGHSDIHAFMTPTTRGLRRLLKEDLVEYKMPLKKSGRLSGDSGIASTADSTEGTTPSQAPEQEVMNSEDEDGNEEVWPDNIRVEELVQRLINKQAKVFDREREVDLTPESLIFVEGIEVHALCNSLRNFQGMIANSGVLAGVSPTILAPVAFRGATLKPLLVLPKCVQVKCKDYHSLEIRGPILPHMVQNLCNLLKNSHDEFSATFVNLETTRAFSLAAQTTAPTPTMTKDPPVISSAFNKENLSDCGLDSKVLENLCCDDTSRVTVVDSIKYNTDRTYSWY